MTFSSDSYSPEQRFILKHWYVPVIFAVVAAFIGSKIGNSFQTSSDWRSKAVLTTPRVSDMQGMVAIYSLASSPVIHAKNYGPAQFLISQQGLGDATFKDFFSESLLYNNMDVNEFLPGLTSSAAKFLAKQEPETRRLTVEIVSPNPDADQLLGKVIEELNKSIMKLVIADVEKVIGALVEQYRWAGLTEESGEPAINKELKRLKQILASLKKVDSDGLAGKSYRIVSPPSKPILIEGKVGKFWIILGGLVGLFFGIAALVLLQGIRKP